MGYSDPGRENQIRLGAHGKPIYHIKAERTAVPTKNSPWVGTMRDIDQVS